MWQQLLENIRNTITHSIYHVGLVGAPQAQSDGASDNEAPAPLPANNNRRRLRENRQEEAALPAAKAAGRKVGRNDPCPCGSGRKYKKCHGVAA